MLHVHLSTLLYGPQKKGFYLHDELQRLISLLGLKTSVYNIESRIARDGNVYIMEVSPRGGAGTDFSEMIRYIYGVDLLKYSTAFCRASFQVAKLIKTADIWVRNHSTQQH